MLFFSNLCLVFAPNFSCLLLSFLARGRQALESVWRSPTGAHRSCAEIFRIWDTLDKRPDKFVTGWSASVTLTEQVCHPLDACQGTDVA